MIKKGIFLHFLDRELRKSISKFVSDKECKKIVLYSLFMGERIYALVTHVIESVTELPETIALILELEKLNLITFISSRALKEELILNRRELYKDDEKNYPFYFGEDKQFEFSDNIVEISDSTTQFIYDSLLKSHKKCEDLNKCKDTKYILDYIITSKLKQFHGEGLTINAFRTILPNLENYGVDKSHIVVAVKNLNEELIILHNTKYLKATNSSIIQNIPYISRYDKMDYCSLYNFEIYQAILSPIFQRKDIELLKHQIVQWRYNEEFFLIIYVIDEFINLIYKKYKIFFENYNYNIAIQMLVEKIKNAQRRMRLEIYRFKTISGIKSYIEDLGKRLGIDLHEEEEGSKYMRILLPVANMTEFGNILEVAKQKGMEMERVIGETNTYHVYENEQYMLIVVKCEEGSVGPAASALTLADAVVKWNIDTIIFSGIAFGNYLKKEKIQSIGDILVSKQIWNYESGKVSQNKYISRGDKVTASPWLLDRFENSALEWRNSKIHFGLIASGEKLVDSEEVIHKLMDEEPELIGGEMEGNGLVSVAERYKKDWILVKAISDWGIGKTSDNQKEASINAFNYIFGTIQNYM